MTEQCGCRPGAPVRAKLAECAAPGEA